MVWCGAPSVYPSSIFQVDKKYALKRKTREEKEADLVGRLSTPALKALLEEHGRWALASWWGAQFGGA